MQKLRFILLALAALFMVNGSLIAQEKGKKEKKKVVIIKETVDEDGNVVKEKIIKEGDDVKDVKKWHVKEGNEKVIIIKEGDGEKTIKVIVDGEDDVINIKELEHEMEKSISVNVDVDENDGKKNMVIKIKGEDGEVETIKWQGEEGEMPDGLLEELGEKGIHIDIHEDHDHDKNVFIHSDKPFLGVMAAETVEVLHESHGEGEEVEEKVEELEDRGALISDIVEGSAAEEAGLKGGDIITKVDDEEIGDFGDLADALGKYKVGDTVKISYLRDNKPMETSATLKKHTGALHIEGDDLKWVDEDEGHIYIRKAGKKGKTITIEVEEEDGVKEKKIIIKEKKKNKEE
ncbi:MAG: PDZ domain-containing protein [Bacteroidetes bacterium]|nr:MAG: PDZ domain-containing protein [Bacteroidota bacterium]